MPLQYYFSNFSIFMMVELISMHVMNLLNDICFDY